MKSNNTPLSREVAMKDYQERLVGKPLSNKALPEITGEGRYYSSRFAVGRAVDLADANTYTAYQYDVALQSPVYNSESATAETMPQSAAYIGSVLLTSSAK